MEAVAVAAVRAAADSAAVGTAVAMAVKAMAAAARVAVATEVVSVAIRFDSLIQVPTRTRQDPLSVTFSPWFGLPSFLFRLFVLGYLWTD